MKVKNQIFFSALLCIGFIPSLGAMEQAQSITQVQSMPHGQKRSATQLESTPEAQEPKKLKLKQPDVWDVQQYVSTVSPIMPKKLKRNFPQYSKPVPPQITAAFATPKARTKRMTLAQLQEVLSHYRPAHEPIPQPVAPPLSLQLTSCFEKHAIIQVLKKAATENDFKRYFELLETETSDMQRKLCQLPVHKNGSKAVHFAAQEGNTQAILKLESLGALLDEPNNDSYTPLLFAAQMSLPAMALLIGKGADKNRLDKSGNSLLFAARMAEMSPLLTHVSKNITLIQIK